MLYSNKLGAFCVTKTLATHQKNHQKQTLILTQQEGKIDKSHQVYMIYQLENRHCQTAKIKMSMEYYLSQQKFNDLLRLVN